MREQVKAFLEFLRLNRNVSPHTLIAYESDLAQFIASLSAHHGVPRPDLAPGQVTQASISVHAWFEANLARGEEGASRYAFVFGPSISIGNVGLNL